MLRELERLSPVAETTLEAYPVGMNVTVQLKFRRSDTDDWHAADEAWSGQVRPLPMGYTDDDAAVNVMPNVARGAEPHPTIHPRLLSLLPLEVTLERGQVVTIQTFVTETIQDTAANLGSVAIS